MEFIEKVQRRYSNGVVIVYELMANNVLYIHTITSIHKMRGYATASLKSFIDEFSHKDIYLFSTFELGTDIAILDKWYEKIGFKEVNNITHIPYGVTHIKERLR